MYSRKIGDETLSFGVSGLLYRSNVLMYDHQGESLWSQILREAVTGPRTGTRLDILPSTLTTWERWRKAHPDTQVLSLRTGYVRDYSKDPYEDYYRRRSGLFGFLSAGPGEEDKELVVGVEHAGRTLAFPYEKVRDIGEFAEGAGDGQLKFSYEESNDQLRITDAGGRDVQYIVTYWFVWKAFHPQTARYGR